MAKCTQGSSILIVDMFAVLKFILSRRFNSLVNDSSAQFPERSFGMTVSDGLAKSFRGLSSGGKSSIFSEWMKTFIGLKTLFAISFLSGAIDPALSFSK